MKKLLALSAVLAFLSVPAAFAGTTSGCGLGTQLFKGQSGMVPNVLAVTTNGISGNQTFGVTSGTSGCQADNTVYQEQQQVNFVAANLDNLSEEMAQGQGQYVNALANLMGCPVDLRADFSRFGQDNYESLFSAPQPEPQVFLNGLKGELRKDAVLSRGCTGLA
jgi:hypothetical protein